MKLFTLPLNLKEIYMNDKDKKDLNKLYKIIRLVYQ